MKINIVERKVDITQDVKEYVQKKIGKLDKFFHKDASASIVFSSQRNNHKSEITIVNGGMVFRAQEITTDFFASIDGAITRIETQIKKNKTRLEKRLRDGAFEKLAYDDMLVEDKFEVLRRKKFNVKPMSVEEAILQMNLIGHTFFMFKDFDNDNRNCVVYKRSINGYGIIESDT